jgi:hypothetical protein
VPTTAQLDFGEVAINTHDGKIYIKKDDGVESIVEISQIGLNSTATTSSISQTEITSWPVASYGGAKILIEAKDGVNRHITEMIVTHDDTAAYAAEYGSIWSSAPLATFDVDVNGGNVRVLATPSSINNTIFNITRILMKA